MPSLFVCLFNLFIYLFIYFFIFFCCGPNIRNKEPIIKLTGMKENTFEQTKYLIADFRGWPFDLWGVQEFLSTPNSFIFKFLGKIYLFS